MCIRDRYISSLLSKVKDAVDHLLKESDLGPDIIDSVIRTGGSSLIPAIKNILDDLFPGKVIEHDPFTSVATGLAIANYRQLGKAPNQLKTSKFGC